MPTNGQITDPPTDAEKLSAQLFAGLAARGSTFEGDWDAVKAFIEAVGLTQNLSLTQVISTTRGRNGATMAHWQVGMGYAQYLSPDFHMWCNTVVRERMEGKALASATSISPDDRSIIGGIVKQVVHAQLEPVRQENAALAREVAELREIVAHPDHVGAREVLDQARVPSQGRRPLLSRTTAGLSRYSRQHEFDVRREAFTRRKLFHVRAVDGWRRVQGDALIARHLDAVTGQGRLPLGGLQ